MTHFGTKGDRSADRHSTDSVDKDGPFIAKSVLLRCRRPLFALTIVVFFSIGHFGGAVQKEEEILRATSIVAGKFEVRGPDGKVAASLFRGPKGEPVLSFFDDKGHARMTMGLDANRSPMISLSNEQGAPKLVLGLDRADGTPLISMSDDRGEPTISIGVTKGLGSEVTVGKSGAARVSIEVSGKGVPAIRLWDAKNNPRISLALENENPIISLFGENREVRATWRVFPDGSPAFSLFDRESRVRLAAAVDKDGKPSIRIIDPEKHEERDLAK